MNDTFHPPGRPKQKRVATGDYFYCEKYELTMRTSCCEEFKESKQRGHCENCPGWKKLGVKIIPVADFHKKIVAELTPREEIAKKAAASGPSEYWKSVRASDK